MCSGLHRGMRRTKWLQFTHDLRPVDGVLPQPSLSPIIVEYITKDYTTCLNDDWPLELGTQAHAERCSGPERRT